MRGSIILKVTGVMIILRCFGFIPIFYRMYHILLPYGVGGFLQEGIINDDNKLRFYITRDFIIISLIIVSYILTGLFGLKFSDDEEKTSLCIILAVIGMVLTIVQFILRRTTLLYTIADLIIPITYIYGAYLNTDEYDYEE